MQAIMGKGSYPGRIVGLGVTKSRKPLAIYAVSGRSEMSKERRAAIVNDGVQIEPLGELTPEQEASKDLIIYRAIRIDVSSKGLVVSNGRQTDPVYDLIFHYGLGVRDAIYATMYTMGFEPDRLCTPRLAGVFRLQSAHIERALSMVVADDGQPSGKHVEALLLDPIDPGKVSFITTYTGDFENPQAPVLEKQDNWIYSTAVEGDSAEEIAQELYEAVDANVRVAAVAAVLETGGWSLAVHNLHP